MKVGLCTCVLFHLFITGDTWPRYGRPHPLYNGRQQTAGNIFASAVLLGFDFNELQSIQEANSPGFGLGNLGLPNNGFPMNAYERNRARQDVNTLTVLGVIDSPEEAGPLGALVSKSAPDPPDNPGGNNGGGKGKKKSRVKTKGKSIKKIKSKQSNKRKPISKMTHNQQVNNNVISNSEKIKPRMEKTTQVTAKAVGVKGQDLKAENIKSVIKTVPASAVSKFVKKKLAKQKRKGTQRIHGDKTDGADSRSGRGNGIKRSKTRRNLNYRGTGEDAGEGYLAEQGVGDLGDRPLRGRRGRTGGEEARTGGSEVFDRRKVVGRTGQ